MRTRQILKGTAATVLIFLVIGMVVIYFCKPVYYRLYPWDRISGTVHVTMDGRAYELKPDSFGEYIYEGDAPKPMNISILNDGSAEIGIKGGGYGEYSTELRIASPEIRIGLGTFQFNWWNVERFDLYIDIDTVNGTVRYSGEKSFIAEDGRTENREIDKTQSIGEDLWISL